MPSQVNIALNRPTTTSSFVKPYEPARAVDGNTNPVRRWLCNDICSNRAAWMTVNLGNLFVINRWVVRHMGAAGWKSPDYNLCDFKLQVSSDNAHWTDVDSVTNNSLAITDRTITNFYAGNYVRLYVTKGLRTDTNLTSIMELEIYGQQPSPYLATLTVNDGVVNMPLTPTFSPTVGGTYTTPDVDESVSQVKVTATTQDTGATLKINGVVTQSGTTVPVTLNVGSNTINITVTSYGGGITQAYSVAVTRKAPQEIVELSGLSINPGSLNETFAPTTTSYTANEGYDTGSITVTPTTNVSGATITVNGVAVASGTPSGTINLNTGSNTVTVVVAKGTNSKTYTITVTRASSPYLTQVDVIYGSSKSPKVTSITINKTQTEYNADVDNSTTTVTIKVYSEDPNAKILVNGNQNLTNGQTSTSIPVNVSQHTRIPIVVTSSIGVDSKQYGITVI